MDQEQLVSWFDYFSDISYPTLNNAIKEIVEELTDSHASNSYFKTLMWLDEGNLPKFVENDIKAFLKQNKQIEQKDKIQLSNAKNL